MFAILLVMASTSIVVIILVSLCAIVISAVLHELMHGYVAKYLGDTTAQEQGRLTLNPIAHIDPIFTVALPVLLAVSGMPIFGAAKPVPVQGHRLRGEEFGMALVAVMGPLTNLFLATLGALIYAFIPASGALWDIWWQYFIMINIGFFIFNMIPIPPLDGSRVLYAFAPEPMQRVMAQLERFGIFIVFALVLLGMPFLGPIIQTVYSSIGDFLLSINGGPGL